ncbi:MAG: hypothetical protein OEZ45_14520 [Candidatus Aminicenantes bacterium]|nr:hypothetical protein [Candidatus Aminicenantes bacterium]
MTGMDTKEKRRILEELLPHEVHGWEAKGKDELYNPQTIFNYIDGAGEVYRSYSFTFLLARRYSKENQPDIVADVFEMSSSRDAYGVFTHDLEGEDAGVGRGSTYKGGLLSFWKDRFFVSLYAEEETEETKKALFLLGEKVASSIQSEGEMPDIVALLPQEDLVEKSVHYFHNHLILNYHFYVSDENILLLDQETEAALGTYREKNEKSHLLVVRYPEEAMASQAFKSFTGAYMPDAKEVGLVQTEDMKWTAAEVKRNFVIIVFNAPSVPFARDIVEKVVNIIE